MSMAREVIYEWSLNKTGRATTLKLLFRGVYKLFLLFSGKIFFNHLTFYVYFT